MWFTGSYIIPPSRWLTLSLTLEPLQLRQPGTPETDTSPTSPQPQQQRQANLRVAAGHGDRDVATWRRCCGLSMDSSQFQATSSTDLRPDSLYSLSRSCKQNPCGAASRDACDSANLPRPQLGPYSIPKQSIPLIMKQTLLHSPSRSGKQARAALQAAAVVIRRRCRGLSLGSARHAQCVPTVLAEL